MRPRKWYIAGTGNLGTTLGALLSQSNALEFGGWLSRNPTEKDLSPVFDLNKHSDPSAGVFLCIPDRFIEDAANALKHRFGTIVHCSGMQPLFASCDAVCWPMQTFSGHVPSAWKEVPVFIECRDPDLRLLLSGLFQMAGAKPLNSQLHERQTAHLAAVIANNFSNAMFVFAGHVLTSGGLDPHLLMPIIRQTAEKLNYTSAINAQTGPAIRQDFKSIDMQSEMLNANPEWQRLYEEISAAIPFLFKK